MSLTDHIAILTHAALAAPVVNQKKAAKPLEFYALLAFPPAAGNDLAELAKAVAPGGNLAGQSMTVKPNAKQDKPLPGIPGDWLVVRAATQFAPFIADEHGKQLEQGNADHASLIRSKFYAGKKVRASLTAYAWTYDKKPGISYNLAGVMEAGDGERLNIGSGVTANAFEKYATAGESAANPFAGNTATTTVAAPPEQANPFAQTGAAPAAANPFG